MEFNESSHSNDFVAFGGTSPSITTTPSNLSYTSYDGKSIYLNFDDIDSTGLEPSSGLELRFSVTKKFGAIASTVTPTSTFIDSTQPKTLQLILSTADKVVDSSYSGSGVALTAQTVFVSYDASSFGTSVPKLSDNDTSKSFVSSFTGVGITNLTKESNPPVFSYATSSGDGNKIYVYYNEATPTILPTSGIVGFAVTQNSLPVSISTGYVLDPTDSTNGKIVVLELSSTLEINDGTNPVTLTYNQPISDLFKIRDSTGTGLTFAVALSGVAVTNITTSTDLPNIISTYTATGSTSVVVNVLMSTTTLPSSPSGFGVSVNGVARSISSIGASAFVNSGTASTIYQLTLSSFYSPEDIIFVNYTKPTTSFITDNSANLNQLASLPAPIRVTNLLTDTQAPSLDSGSSYVETTGKEIYLKFTENNSRPLLPSSNASLFKVFIDGQSTPYKTVTTLGVGVTQDIKISLYNRIFSDSVVGIGYSGNGSAFSLRDSSGNYISNFEPTTILNNATYDAYGFFDAKDWNDSLDNNTAYGFGISESLVDVFVKSEFYPNASVIYDTEPPYGAIILNKKSDDVDPGVKVHYFSGLGYSSLTVTEQSTSIVDFKLDNLQSAFQFYSDRDQNISTITVKLKKTGNILNMGDSIIMSVYSTTESTNTPTTLLGTLSGVQVSELTTSYATYSFTTTAISITADTFYWAVLTLDNLPIAVTGSVSIELASHEKTDYEVAYFDETDTKWVRLANRTAYYDLASFNTVSLELNSKDYLLDIYENPIKEVTLYGGSSDLSKYEVIGNENFNYVLKKFDKVYEDLADSANDIYPTVTNIVVGATARNSKTYVLQIKETPSSAWKNVFENVADTETLDYLNFAFDTPIKLYAARLFYRGDYFTIDQTADLTLAAYDKYSNVVSAQISRYADFRDASNFPNADSKGFIDFSYGETTFANVDLVNAPFLWDKKLFNASSDINAIVTFNDKILIAASNKMFVYKDGEVYQVISESLVDEKYQITCLHVYNGRAYAGTNNGLLFVSYNGEFWSVINAKQPLLKTAYKTIKPITSLTSIGEDLYIGTSKGDTSASSVYKYDGAKLEKIRDFNSYDQVSSLAAKDFTLFVGLGGAFGSDASAIYKYSNSEWNQTLTSDFDNVEALCKSVTRSSVLAAFRGGQVWELTYENNIAKTWKKIFDTYADHIFSIYDDPNGNYVYISTDNGVYGYFLSAAGFKKITSYNYETNHLNKVWRSYTAATGITWTDIADIESYNYISGSAQTTAINFGGSGTALTFPAGYTYPSLTLEGAIKAEKDGACTFRVDSSVGFNLFLNDSIQINNFKSTTTLETKFSTNTFTLSEGEFVKFKLQTYNNVGTGSTIRLYWQKSSLDPYELIPATQFFGVSKIKSVSAIGNTFYGAGQDGSIYQFLPTPYENNTRNVYVRFKDQAGNVQGIVLPAHTEPFELLSDKLLQTSNVSNNPSSFIQNEITSVVSNSNTTINPITGEKQNSNTDLPTQSQVNNNTNTNTNTNTNNNNQVLNTTNNNGVIYQIVKNADNSLSRRNVYVPPSRLYPIYAPDRKIREHGIYEPQPIYVPTLIGWSELVALILNKYPATPDSNIDNGTAVNIYIKSGDTRSACLAANYSNASSLSSINDAYATTTAQSLSVDISSYSGKWLQYKVELVTSSKNLSPELLSVALTYNASQGSYFFTRMFDTENYDTTIPKIKRGLLTSNELKNNGSIVYGYTTTDATNETYNFENYTVITPNKTFELSEASSKIRFGILLTSTSSTPSIVYDFAVQLDIGDANIKFMPEL